MRSFPIYLLLSLLAATGCALPEAADVIYRGGMVHTLDPDAPHAEAVASRDGEIVFVGSNAAVERYRGEATRVYDLESAVVYPGLIDSHMHLLGVGERALSLDLTGVPSLSALLARTEEHAATLAPGEWVIGRGWNETLWTPRRFPTRAELDAVSGGHPVCLRRIDGHAVVANSRALAIAGVDAVSEDPAGGEILRDADGAATGVLLDRAMGLVTKHLPPLSVARRRQALLEGARIYGSRGWTGVQIAGIDFEVWPLLEELVATGEIGLRVYAAQSAPGPGAEWLLERGPQLGARQGRATSRSLKVYADGALGSGGAALLEPYADRAGAGLILNDEGELLDLFRRALRVGVQIQVHAIGDRANRWILDCFERAFAEVPVAERAVAEPRWRIEHAQILHPDDVARFAALGVIASMQPSHAISDLHMAPARLGLERLVGAYAWRSLLDSGARLAAGSDAPVEVGDPRIEFYAAVARRDLDGYSADGWHPEQAVTRHEALRMLTMGGAYAAFEESWRGSIEVGKVCDLSIFADDWLRIAEAQIPDSHCLMTVVAGEPIYQAQ